VNSEQEPVQIDQDKHSGSLFLFGSGEVKKKMVTLPFTVQYLQCTYLENTG